MSVTGRQPSRACDFSPVRCAERDQVVLTGHEEDRNAGGEARAPGSGPRSTASSELANAAPASPPMPPQCPWSEAMTRQFMCISTLGRIGIHRHVHQAPRGAEQQQGGDKHWPSPTKIRQRDIGPQKDDQAQANECTGAGSPIRRPLNAIASTYRCPCPAASGQRRPRPPAIGGCPNLGGPLRRTPRHRRRRPSPWEPRTHRPRDKAVGWATLILLCPGQYRDAQSQ